MLVFLFREAVFVLYRIWGLMVVFVAEDIFYVRIVNHFGLSDDVLKSFWFLSSVFMYLRD
tara:strand:+ start:4651 stop:4830 length:180 start_codon:yes stop_codon:yes gene_type:complete